MKYLKYFSLLILSLMFGNAHAGYEYWDVWNKTTPSFEEAYSVRVTGYEAQELYSLLDVPTIQVDRIYFLRRIPYSHKTPRAGNFIDCSNESFVWGLTCHVGIREFPGYENPVSSYINSIYKNESLTGEAALNLYTALKVTEVREGRKYTKSIPFFKKHPELGNFIHCTNDVADFTCTVATRFPSSPVVNPE